MVALLQNAQRRNEIAMHRKLDAIADALADFMDKSPLDLKQDVKELEEAVWLEKVQSSKDDEDEGERNKASSGAGDDRKHAGHRDRRRRRSVVAKKGA